MSRSANIDNSAAYVAARAPGESDAWSALTTQAGRKGSQILREVAEVKPLAEVRDALGLGTEEKAVVRRRLICLDDHPIELTDSYYPPHIAGGTALAGIRKIPGGAPTLLAKLGFIADEVREEITARPATDDEAELLGIDPGAPVLVLFRITLTKQQVPFEVSVMTMVAEGRQLRYALKVR